MLIIYSIFALLFFAIFFIHNSFAFTYESQDWWFAPEQQNQISGNIGIIFTYPDKVIKNDTMDVDVRIEYMKNENARSEYVVLDDLKIHIRDLDSRLDNDLESSTNITSPILLPDGIFSHKFVIPTENIEIQVEKSYAVDLSFTVMFGRKTILETYYWDSGEYFGNSIETRELKPFKVIDKKNNPEKELTIRVNKPFGFFIPLNVTINNNIYNMTEDAITINSKNLRNNLSNSQSQTEDPETVHKIKLNSWFPLLEEHGHPIMRANFSSWSDGNKSPEREINLHKNTELFAFYKTQYYLNVSSEGNYGKINGTNYYDSGSRAQFSIVNVSDNTPKIFDHWKGDIDTDSDATLTSNSIIMNGPKDIRAYWKENSAFSFIYENFEQFFYSFIAAAIIGPIIGWMLSITPSRIEKKRQLTYLKTYIDWINDIFKEYINEEDKSKILLEQKRKEITSLLQSGIINVETFRLLNEHIKNLIDDISK
jgi:hypothetical protein